MNTVDASVVDFANEILDRTTLRSGVVIGVTPLRHILMSGGAAAAAGGGLALPPELGGARLTQYYIVRSPINR